jgi:hypothetical protein
VRGSSASFGCRPVPLAPRGGGEGGVALRRGEQPGEGVIRPELSGAGCQRGECRQQRGQRSVEEQRPLVGPHRSGPSSASIPGGRQVLSGERERPVGVGHDLPGDGVGQDQRPRLVAREPARTRRQRLHVVAADAAVGADEGEGQTAVVAEVDDVLP